MTESDKMGLNMVGILLNLEMINEFEELERRHNFRLYTRNLRNAGNPFDLPEVVFRQWFRLSKELALEICNQIRPEFQLPIRTTCIPVHLKFLLALHFFAHGSYQGGIGGNLCLCVSQPTVSRAISLVTNAIIRTLMPTEIKFPTTEEQITTTKQKFWEKFHFPGVIGCLDGTHIPIISPPVNDVLQPGIAYLNRKGYYSLNVQIICNSDLIITGVNARYPGATHDSGIWAMSNIKRNLEARYYAGERNTWLLGDSGYPSQPWLLTPIVDALPNSPEERYTRAHILTRNSVERVNGVLKGRFRCLHKHRVLHYSPTKAGKIIYACCILHNLCRKRNVPEDFDLPEDSNSESDDDEPPENNIPANIFRDARRIREQVVQQYFQN